MAEIIFINPYPENAHGINEGTVEPPLGLGYLASVAEQNNISCSIIDANVLRMKIDDVFSEIKKYRPRIVGLSVNLYTYQVSLKLTDKIKEDFPRMEVILGGPTPSSMPLKVMRSCRADAVVIGEGEATLQEIIHNYKNSLPLFKDVRGVVYRSGEKIVKNDDRDFVKDIDTISFPAYHLFPDLNIYKTRSKTKPVAPLLTSRGCPYQCIFCSKDIFKNICRTRSPENLISEIEMLIKKYQVRQIDILDDNFTVNKNRLERFLDLLIEKDYDLVFNLQSGVRIESLDQNIINKMRKARIWKMAIGVESGDPAILKRIKKQLDLNRVLEVTRMAKKAGMEVYGFFIIGLPGETPQSMQKTIDFAIKMDPAVANFCLCIPFPGTELYEMINKEGRFLVNMADGIDAGFYANKAFYEMGPLNKALVLRYYKKAVWDFYFRPRKMLELAARIRSKNELGWFFNTGLSVIKNLGRN